MVGKESNRSKLKLLSLASLGRGCTLPGQKMAGVARFLGANTSMLAGLSIMTIRSYGRPKNMG